MSQQAIPAGVGLYTQADAARLLKIHPRRLQRWVQGYTYYVDRPRSQKKRAQNPVVLPDIGRVDGMIALSFLELMELRVVKALVEFPDISLQKIRKASRIASVALDTRHPFASRRIFTDGRAIFADLAAGREPSSSNVIELTESTHLQIQALKLIEQSLLEIDFDDESSLAKRWWPLGRLVPVVLDPEIVFGAPVIEGTRIRTSVIYGFTRRDPESTVANAYNLDLAKVRAAAWFESQLAAA